MIQIISEPVSVTTSFDANKRATRPISLQWGNQSYEVTQLGLRHSYKEGNVRHHIFSVVSNNLFFRLNLNTDTLHWTLEEVSDGLPD
ncbi:MAG: hypothetical protein DPW11_04680 [bacterium]|nr:hypothetical protein [Candidatus Microgenomates bacterium CPR3]MCQ3945039.1 hypothetical protein [bacterium]RIK51468.1 MAG: hypothetical protein DCC61_02435 [Candidatus Microgenomates bacterium]